MASKTQFTNTVWTIFYTLLFLNLLAFSAVLLSLKPFWVDINDFIIELSGVSLNWILLVLVLTSCAVLYALFLSLSGILSIKKKPLRTTHISTKITAIAVFVVCNGLLTVLSMELGDLIFAFPKTNYSLPDPLLQNDGKKVTDPRTWKTAQRPSVLALFESQVYGKAPGRPDGMFSEVISVKRNALNGTATRKEVSLHLVVDKKTLRLDLLIYHPNNREEAVPLFLGLNFRGNHAIEDDPDITLSNRWMENSRKYNITGNRATESSRGLSAPKWPAGRIVQRGYALATLYYGDIDPDYDDGFKNGAHHLFDNGNREEPEADAWGAISAWAWGLSRVMDYVITENDIDAGRVIVFGHSRLGKTALWAGALDQRFAMVISNNSGCMGAALSRRRFGENVKIINRDYPHWFCRNFHQYSDREDELPIDQHMLIALIAPRPVYIASAEQDAWSDPEGEFLSAKFASPVYRLFNKTGLSAEHIPELNEPVMSDIGYHIRPGRHDVKPYDWERFMDFADRHLKK